MATIDDLYASAALPADANPFASRAVNPFAARGRIGTPGIAPTAPRARPVAPFRPAPVSGGGGSLARLAGLRAVAPSAAVRTPADLSGLGIDYVDAATPAPVRSGILAKPNVGADVASGLLRGLGTYLQARQTTQERNAAQARTDALEQQTRDERNRQVIASVLGYAAPGAERDAAIGALTSEHPALGGLRFTGDPEKQRLGDQAAAEIRRIAGGYSNPAPLLDAATATAAGQPVLTYPGGGAQQGPPESGLAGAFREAGQDKETRVEEARLALETQREKAASELDARRQQARADAARVKLEADRGNKDAQLRWRYLNTYQQTGGDPLYADEWVNRQMAADGVGQFAAPAVPALPGFGQTGATAPGILRGWQGGAGANPGTIEQPNFFAHGTVAGATIRQKDASADAAAAAATLRKAQEQRYEKMTPLEIDKVIAETGLTKARTESEGARMQDFLSLMKDRDAHTRYMGTMAAVARGRLDLDEKKQAFEAAKEANAELQKAKQPGMKALLQQRENLLGQIGKAYAAAQSLSIGNPSKNILPDAKGAAKQQAYGDSLAQRLRDIDAKAGFDAGNQTLPPSAKQGPTANLGVPGSARARYIAAARQQPGGKGLSDAELARRADQRNLQ